MKIVQIIVDDSLYEFYQKNGQRANKRKPEQVMADARFQLAGELSLRAIHQKEKGEPHTCP